MTNGQSESTELQENQDRPSYQKLPSDEEPEKAVNTSKHRLSVEVELNKGTKESSTDDDSLKDNPLISNGDHGGSLKNLDSSKISINGDLNQSKKLDEDDEEEEDQDSFMFGMSKWRTFFFFLSLALLLVFVLVFVFVLPCSESAQMNERTNHITHQAVAGLTSKTGDMDGDGVEDLIYFKNSAEPNKRARRNTDNSQTASNCIVDGNTESCVGQIVIVSTKLGSPIATRSVALVPQMSSNSLGAANAIECASGGDRKKIVCTFHNSGKFYVIDMKAKSNLTSIATEGCPKLSMTPMSAKDSTSFGFIVGCASTDGMKYTFVDGTTLKRSVELSKQYNASMEPIETVSVQLMDADGKKATVLATLFRSGESIRLSLEKASSIVPSDVPHGNIPLNVGTLLSNESGLNIDIEGLDASKSWNMVLVGNELVFYSTSDVAVPRREKEVAVITVQSEIKSVAPSSMNSKPVNNVLMKVFPSSFSTKCTFQLATFDDSDSLTVSKKTLQLDSLHDMPVNFINAPQYRFFTSWYFKETTQPETSESEANDDSEKEENGDNVVEEAESGSGSENESVEKRSAEEEQNEGEESEKDCEPKWEATLIAYSEKSFSNPMPIYTAPLCSEHSLSFIGVTTSHGEAMYTISVNKGPVSSVFTINLPEGKVVSGSGGGHKFKLSWEEE